MLEVSLIVTYCWLFIVICYCCYCYCLCHRIDNDMMTELLVMQPYGIKRGMNRLDPTGPDPDKLHIFPSCDH